MKKKYFLSFILVSTLLIIGCGENSDLSEANIQYDQQNIFNSVVTNKVTYTDYTVEAVDDIITGAKVSAPECNSSIELKPGLYNLKGCVSKPTYIVVEGGTIGDTNITQTFPLVLNVSQTDKDNNFVVTPLTTLLADANSSEVENLANKLGISKYELFENPNNVKEINLTKINQKLNVLYIKSIQSGAVANKVKFIDVVREKVLSQDLSRGDINLTELSNDVRKFSQDKPQFFGVVFISLKDRNTNILDELKTKKTTKISFVGLVFDKIIPNANINVTRLDTNEVIAITKAGSEGNWTLELNKSMVDDIKNNDFILQFTAVDPQNNKIVLKSSITSKELRKYLSNNYVTFSEVPELTISNITTAEDAILNKQGAFKNSQIYQDKKVALKFYNKDKVIKTAAVIKKVVDENKTDILKDNSAKNTFDLIAQKVTVSNNDYEVNLSNNLEDINTTDVEKNMTQNAILNTQINYVPSLDNKITLQTISDKYSNGVYYRLLAYYDKNGNFVREYDKLILIPGNYQIKKCYLYGDNTREWNCNTSDINEKSNYSNGNFNIVNGDITITYSLDNNNSIYIPNLCKSYKLYEVSKKEVNTTDVVSNEPEILIDSFDIVDMFRRMPAYNEQSKIIFNKLKELVKNKSRKEVNIEMNRYLRKYLKEVKYYFSNNNSNPQCLNQ